MYTWNQLDDFIRSCTLCPLSRTRRLAVTGKGSREAKLMFVAEAPGASEDKAGVPFVGPAGGVFDRLLTDSGLTWNDIYMTNILKCHPPGNRDPLPSEKELCLPYLRYETVLLHPKLIVCLGRVAAQQIISGDFRITRQHGVWTERMGYHMTAVYHPSALLRDPEKTEETKKDFLAIAEKLRTL